MTRGLASNKHSGWDLGFNQHPYYMATDETSCTGYKAFHVAAVLLFTKSTIDSLM